MNEELKKLIDQNGFEPVLDSLLAFELSKVGKLNKVEWLHALNRRVNAWCFSKATDASIFE